MNKSTLILIFTFLFFACNSKTERNSTKAESTDSSAATSTKVKSESFFPVEKRIEKFDTIIIDRQIEIQIIKTDLDSYVNDEYEQDGKKQIDKYRDAEISLIIKHKSKILLDTVFRKEQFIKYSDKGFIDIAIFHNYWFKKLEKNRIELFGVISKPETDWTLAFNHYFDLASRTLKFAEEKDDE